MKYLITIIIFIAIIIAGWFGYQHFFSNTSDNAMVSSTSSDLGASVGLLENEGKGVISAPSLLEMTLQKPVPILTYHSIEPKPDHAETKLQLHYRVTPENFEKQMQYLVDNGYTPVTLAQLIEPNIFSNPPAKPVVITFDDGWKNQYTYAVPILKKFGFTATFFIVTKSRTGGYMSWDDLRDLVASGFEIASHTETHARLGAITDTQQLMREIQGSKDQLEQTLGILVKTIAYPYYSHNEGVREAVKNAGYLGARAGWGSFKNDQEHVFQLVSQEVVNNPNPFSSVRNP